MPARPPHTLAWDLPALAGPETLDLTSPAFSNGEPIPPVHAAVRAGGENLSPALAWTAVPPGTAQLLLIVEDPDAPTSTPYLHCLALLDASLGALDHGALNPPVSNGVQMARSAAGDGYFGAAPPKTRGPHRYMFQLFALATPIRFEQGRKPRTMQLTDAISEAGEVLARSRLHGTYQRT
ncbi:YbhB/YbcL family Raf kinase inhibitor-like protein [Humibacter antri]